MNRFRVLVCLLAVALGVASSKGDDRPNIVFIFADDLGVNDLNCYGRSEHKTPHLDRLADEGMKFTRAYSAQPICSPSRAAMMTGKSPARLHLTTFLPGRPNASSQKLLHPDIARQLPLEEVTLPELLKPAGYVSACIGKWHLGNKGFGPAEQGFDFVYAGKANTKPTAEEGGKGEYDLTAKAISFLESNRDKPFFLYLAHNTPHVPLGAKPELVEKYRDAFNPVYAAMIETLDDSIGRLLAKLDELKLTEKTLVVFTSDNGGLHVPELADATATNNGVFRAGKGFVYEGGLREPLIVRWPGKVKAGSVIEQPVSTADLTPTFLELAGARQPEPCDYQSLLPILKGDNLVKPRQFFWHFPHYSNQGSRPAGAVIDGKWKLVEHYEDGRMELFDLDRDPGESKDVLTEEPAKAAVLRGALEKWRREVGAQKNLPNPEFDSAAALTCYAPDRDVALTRPARNAMEGTRQMAAWRQAMDAAVKGRAGQGNLSTPSVPDAPVGFIVLNAQDAEVHGEKLRVESQPEKDTVGYWVNPSDYVSWDFDVRHPGKYRVELLQGCGTGNGGSTVDISVSDQHLQFVVAETGHFQAFVLKDAGVIDLPAGKQTLSVRAKTKAKGAVMDLRRVNLTRVP